MSRERIFYLDFIRAFATVTIVLTHFNALFLFNVQRPDVAVITLYVGNIYIGAFGVSLFLIISGAALMHVYGNQEKVDWKRFFKKRAITIFPMFWIAYLCVFLFDFYRGGGFNSSIPKQNIIFSVLGLDGYFLNFGISTFYKVGEWFLGFIIFVYLIFPLIIILMKKAPVVLATVIVALYVLTLVFLRDYPACSMIITTRLPEIVFGMFFIKYIKKVPWYVALAAMAVIVINTVVAPKSIDSNIQVTYIGICSFIVLVFLARFLEFRIVKKVCDIICKYSYPCFIIHHYIISYMAARFNLSSISKFDSHLLFIACCVVISVFSYLLYHVNDKITNSLFVKK